VAGGDGEQVDQRNQFKFGIANRGDSGETREGKIVNDMSVITSLVICKGLLFVQYNIFDGLDDDARC